MSDEKRDFRSLPNSLAAMPSVDSIRFAIAGSGQPDPMAGKAVTGVRADMILAQQETQKQLKAEPTRQTSKNVPDALVRGQVYRVKSNQKICTIMGAADKNGDYPVIMTKSGNRKLINYADLEEI